MSVAKDSMRLDWKVGYNLDCEAINDWIKANYPTDYAGMSADTHMTMWWAVKTTQATKDAIKAHIDGMGKDDGQTVTGTGTSMTMSADPNYLVKVGDKLTVGAETRDVTVVTDQSNYTIDSAFTANPSAAACTICSPEVDSYVSQDNLKAADDLLKAGIDPSKTWDALTVAERKVISGIARTRADLGY